MYKKHAYPFQKCLTHLSHEKNPGWLGYIGDYTTQLYRDYNKVWAQKLPWP